MEGQISKKARNSDNGVHGSTNINEENIVMDILSRLPVKSLMRFKCVAKHWYSLIKDPHFIHLHLNRSKAYRFFIVTTRQKNTQGKLLHIDYTVFNKKRQRSVSFFIADVFPDGSSRVASTIDYIGRNKTPFYYTQILRAVNGLVCFINGSAACVFNIATREVTPWVKSTILMEETQKSRLNRRRRRDASSAYSFGYDPSNKEHKVVGKWVIYDDADHAYYQSWEILTVGHTAWRRIDDVPDCRFAKDSPSVYVNGFIYWYPLNFGSGSFASVTFLLAFDVGTEKFRKIQIPADSGKLEPGVSFRYDNVCLLDMQNRVAILCQTQSSTARLWIYEDNNKIWTRKTILLPFCWGNTSAVFFHATGEADQIFLESHQKSESVRPFDISLHSYCFKDHTNKQIGLQGIPSADHVLKCTRLCTPFYESLIL